MRFKKRKMSQPKLGQKHEPEKNLRNIFWKIKYNLKVLS